MNNVRFVLGYKMPSLVTEKGVVSVKSISEWSSPPLPDDYTEEQLADILESIVNLLRAPKMEYVENLDSCDGDCENCGTKVEPLEFKDWK